MEGVLSFLLFAVFFYLMMRFGCGAHMVHGHHDTGHADAPNHVDPVCGERVPQNEGYGKMHHDRLYRFCSRECLDAFDADPDRFAHEREEATS